MFLTFCFLVFKKQKRFVFFSIYFIDLHTNFMFYGFFFFFVCENLFKDCSKENAVDCPFNSNCNHNCIFHIIYFVGLSMQMIAVFMASFFGVLLLQENDELEIETLTTLAEEPNNIKKQLSESTARGNNILL